MFQGLKIDSADDAIGEASNMAIFSIKVFIF